MGLYGQDILGVPDLQAQIRNEIFSISTNWYVNRCPLVSRIPRVPVGSTTFFIISRSFRKRTANLAANIASTGATTITLDDASPFMQGDVLQLPNGERVELSQAPNVTTNVITVTRGAEGTTPATQNTPAALTLIGNSRTGKEVDQSGVGLKPVSVPQYCQVWQHPVQVGGSAQASTEYQTEAGVRTPFDQFKMDSLQNLMDDMEYTSYYGIGDDGTTTGRPHQKGLRTLLSATRVTSPVSAGAYKAVDLIRDALQTPRQNGGSPDVLIVSSNFMTGLATWGHAVQRIDAGVNIFGTPIDLFEAPFLNGVTIIEAPLLNPFTCIALTSSEVRMRMKRNEFWQPRGVRGDAYEGDWIGEGAIEVDNPLHHAWVEGITTFSAT